MLLQEANRTLKTHVIGHGPFESIARHFAGASVRANLRLAPIAFDRDMSQVLERELRVSGVGHVEELSAMPFDQESEGAGSVMDERVTDNLPVAHLERLFGTDFDRASVTLVLAAAVCLPSLCARVAVDPHVEECLGAGAMISVYMADQATRKLAELKSRPDLQLLFGLPAVDEQASGVSLAGQNIGATS